jgi:hypothetical protein
MKTINKETEFHIPKLNALFQKPQLFKLKIKHLEFPSKSKTLSNFNTTNINFQNDKNAKNYEFKKNNFCQKRANTEFFKSIPDYTRDFQNDKKAKNYEFKKYNFCQKRANTEFFKSIPDYTRTMFPYKELSKKNSDIYKYDDNNFNFNNPTLNSDLKRYTNNSINFRIFNELNKPYHPYFVDKLQKSLLFKIKKRKEKEKEKRIIPLNSIKFLLNDSSKNNLYNITTRNRYLFNENNNINKTNDLFRKEKLKIFLGLKQIKPLKLVIKSKIKDLELEDYVDINYFDDYKLNTKIRNALINDINTDYTNYNLYLDFIKKMPQKINHFQDIYIIPHIRNGLSLHESFIDIDILNDKLSNRNYLSKHISLSMNRIIIIEEMLKLKELAKKEKRSGKEYKFRKKWENPYYNEIKKTKYEKKFANFDLTDYFGKCRQYKFIRVADKKLKDYIFSKYS